MSSPSQGGSSRRGTMTAMVHRGSLSFIRRSSSISIKSDSPHDSMFSPQSPSFIARLRARKQSTHQSTITPAEAAWFLSLPDKVRRQHFTREEQILIRARSELALLDIAPESRILAREDASLAERRQRTQSVACVPVARKPDVISAASPPTGPEPPFHRRSVGSSRYSYAGSPLSPVHALNSPTYQLPQDFRLTPPQVEFQPRTFLRSPTLLDDPWDTTPKIRAPESPPATAERRRSARPTSSSGRGLAQTAHRAQPPPNIQISQPLYVRDPDTKVFLRDCLSGTRFEETLKFGFPANNSFGISLTTPHYNACDAVSPGTQPRLNCLESPEDPENRSELSSFDDQPPLSPDYFFQPKTDRDASVERADRKQSDDSASSPRAEPRVSRPLTAHGAPSTTAYFDELMKRDMTLRMTLTKPELRASDQELYGSQDDVKEDCSGGEESDEAEDPLALEKLTFSDDATGLHGAFAQGGGRKKGIKGLLFRD